MIVCYCCNTLFRDLSLNIRQNLENTLEINLPQSSLSSEINYEIECGICYAYHLENSIPEHSCNNTKCGRLFHQICLSEVKKFYYYKYVCACVLKRLYLIIIVCQWLRSIS